MNDSQFEYELFVIETSLYRSFISCGSAVAMSEDANIHLINESLNSAVTDYIDKVLNSAQKQWDRYKNTVATKKDMQYLKQISDKIKKSNPVFNINDYPTYKLDFLNTIKIIPFNYEMMKDDLKTKDAFVSKYYSRLKVEGKSNIKEGLRKLCFQKPGTIQCNKRVLTESYNFCVTNFFNNRKSIEADIKAINASATGISNALNSVKLAVESRDFFLNCLEGSSRSTINEASTTGTKPQNASKMTFVDSNGDKTDPSDEKQEKSNQSFLKAVNIYMQVSMDIISTKMKLLQEIYNANMSIVTYFDKWSEKNNSNASRNAVARNKKTSIDL